MHETADRLFSIFHSPDFLSLKGIGNEVPIFIHTYDAEREDDLRRMVDHLTKRLQAAGLSLAVIDLFDLILDQLEEEKRLQRIINTEVTMGKPKLLALLSNLSDPEKRLVPRLMHYIPNEVQLTLLLGAGRVYPFLRTHTILEALQPAMTRHPIVLFFPGDYVQESNGSALLLFGAQPSPKLSRPYYRAINLAHYRL
jgi:hypothetical protein